jgi:N-acetylglucosaminyl-diphospho-decaprenol L-rhamnosyltransferase
MDISIIIVSYNTADLTLACLSSLQRTEDELEKEVFVVDNFSRDSSVPLILKLFPQVNIIANKENKGFGAANNQALKECRGRYIVFLNPDTTIKPDTLKNAVNFMDKNGHVGLAGAKILNPDGSLQPSVSFKFPGEKFVKSELTGLAGNIACVMGAFMIAGRPILDRLRGFDEDFFLYGEDQDLCWRIRESGYSIGHIDNAEIFHWGGQSEAQTPPAELYAKKLKAEYLFYKKHYLPETVNRIKKAQIRKAIFRLIILRMQLPFAQDQEGLNNKINCYKIVRQLSGEF